METPRCDRGGPSGDEERERRLLAALHGFHEFLREAVARRPELLELIETLVASLARSEPGGRLDPVDAAEAEPTPSARDVEAEPVEGPEPGEAQPPPAGDRSAAVEPGTRAQPAYVFEPQPEPSWRSRRVQLDPIARRAGLKAEALEWAVRRRELDRPGVDFRAEIQPVDQGLLDRAGALEGCYLWMLQPHGPQDGCEPSELRDLAHAYRAVQLAAEAAGRWDVDNEGLFPDESLTRFLTLVAEAQSGLLAALRSAGRGGDEDQYELWCWLRQVADRKRIFLEQYMSRERLARPSQLDDFPERLGSFLDRLAERERRHKERRQRLHRVAYHVKRIEDALVLGSEAGDAALTHDWSRVAATLDEWVSAGGQVTDRGLLEVVARVASDFPVELVAGHVERVLEAADRWLESRSEERREDRAEAERREPEAGPASAREALERALARHPDRLAEALNGRSDRNYVYARPAEVEEALEWLATDCWGARSGTVDGLDHRALNQRLMERCGWFYRPTQSATTMGRFPDWYRCIHASRTLTLSEHIGRGNAKRQGPNSIRIAFAWHPESRRIVIGFLGQHQKTTQT